MQLLQSDIAQYVEYVLFKVYYIYDVVGLH